MNESELWPRLGRDILGFHCGFVIIRKFKVNNSAAARRSADPGRN